MTAARHCIEASLAAIEAAQPAVLAVVVGAEGSTYVKPGAMALFDADGLRRGWLSGGCLEADIARRAVEVLGAGHAALMDIDTRADEDLLSGSAVGCRGQLHLALLPLSLLPDWRAPARAWLGRGGPLQLCLQPDGQFRARTGELSREWRLPLAPDNRATVVAHARIEKPPAVALFGAGPESAILLPWLRELGWLTTLVEKRPRWAGQGRLADRHLDTTPSQAIGASLDVDAVLVMHHHFELDRETLEALAAHRTPFVGLLGPRRRQQDLFQLLRPEQRQALMPRLHSPVGLRLGGEGPEAIALSIAAQLQRWHGEEDD